MSTGDGVQSVRKQTLYSSSVRCQLKTGEDINFGLASHEDNSTVSSWVKNNGLIRVYVDVRDEVCTMCYQALKT